MRIVSIEIRNFRAFKGRSVKIDLHKTGKNLLVYGENGSGKSSLFFALRDFLECAVKKSDITKFPFRNIFVNTDDGYIKVQFKDPNATRRNPNPQAKVYEWSTNTNETGEQLILEINKTKGFIDYKALLATYFLQQETPTVNIFNLLISSILAHAENDMSRRSFGEEWHEISESLANLNKRSPKQKEALIDKIKTFNDGLRNKLIELKDEAQKLWSIIFKQSGWLGGYIALTFFQRWMAATHTKSTLNSFPVLDWMTRSRKRVSTEKGY